ncbi:zinc-finger domain-containing protein [soil metagenome]
MTTLPNAITSGAVAFDAPEIVVVHSHRAICDGPEGGALGHPRVYLEMGAKGFVECGYCDRRFVLAGDAPDEDERLDPGDYEGSGGH